MEYSNLNKIIIHISNILQTQYAIPVSCRTLYNILLYNTIVTNEFWPVPIYIYSFFYISAKYKLFSYLYSQVMFDK